jgi:tricorn protease
MRLLPTIFVSLAASAAMAAVPDNEGYYMQPSLRGDVIAFVSQGRIWKVSAMGGHAEALTSNGAPASRPQISPDGKSMAFTGTYEGPADAYLMPLDGGAPKRLTVSGGVATVGWRSSGRVLLATRRYSTLPDVKLASIDPETGKVEIEPLSQASSGSFDEAKKTLFFTRLAFQGSSTKRYQGGTAQNLWKYVQGAEESKPLTADYAGTSKEPMVWEGRVYFLSDRDGTMNLWCIDESGGGLKELTHHSGWDIQSASLDRGRVAYQLGADIHIYDTATASDRVVPITLDSDFDQTLEHWIDNPSGWITAIAFSPDGKKITVTARGQVFVIPTEAGRVVDATRKPGVRYRNARFMPDGKSVIALSDETGETEWWKFPANGVGQGEQITSGSNVLGLDGVVSPDSKHLAYVDKAQTLWLLDLTTKQKQKVFTSPDDVPGDLKWSPDSQWLSYTMPTRRFSQVALYSLKSGQSTPVTTDRSDASSACWTPDGKWLYFLSDRTFNTEVGSPWGNREPEPYFTNKTKIYYLALQKGSRSPFLPDDESYTPPAPAKPSTGTPVVDVQLDGLSERLYTVPISAGNYAALDVNGDRLFAVSQTHGGPPELVAIDIKNKDVTPKALAGGIAGYQLSDDGKKLLINTQGRFFVEDASFPGGPLTKPIDFNGWKLSVQPRREWRQMFLEAWRLHRDYFYDPNMHAVDWKGVLDRYLPLVDRVRNRDELSNLISQMVGELSVLHTFVVGGDAPQPLHSVSVANFGADLEPASGGYRVTRIYRGDVDYPDEISPLSRPEVAVGVGDVIQSIDGVSLAGVSDPNLLLREKAGQEVLIHVRDTGGKERDCIVRPIDGGEFAGLRYSDWEVSRRKMVDDASAKSIGYVHLQAMGSGDIDRWERDFYPVFDRQGLIIDVRHNNGGNIDSWILEKLLRKAWFFWQPRIGPALWNMPQAFRGHVVVLCDEHTASDGEAFTEGIKRLKLGEVIGTRTWGGEVWLSFDNTLVDNGIASAAETGVYGPEGKWLIEGHGVEPDIEVDNLPHATFTGKDAQLEAAIAYLQKEIKEHPMTVPPTPKYPNKAFPYKKQPMAGSNP